MTTPTRNAARLIVAATTASLAATLAAAAGSPAQAQPVWRCGSSYQPHPCPGGTPVPTQDGQGEAQRLRNDAEVARQARAAEALEKARLQAERQAPRPPVLPAAQEEPPAPEGGEVFTARVPRAAKGSKARKAAKVPKASKAPKTLKAPKARAAKATAPAASRPGG